MLGKKLHRDEDPKLSLKVRVLSITEKFCERFPHVLARTLDNDVYKARCIYDITQMLSGNQIRSIKNIMADNIRRVAQKNVSKVVKYCK